MIGRAVERETAARLLRDGVRVVTIWGPPGIGKTHLATALCTPETIRVPLAGVGDLDGLVAAVAAATSPRSVEPDPARLIGRCLFLDNLEHLLDVDENAVVRRLRRWLDAAHGSQILSTSRRLTRLAEEHAVALGPLSEEDALALFLAYVRRQRPGYEPHPDERQDWVALVALLEGIPLALEIAAARWELLGTRALRERVAEPLRVLARPRADDPRHTTLRGAIAWSWDLLSPSSREALKAVACFEGTFDLAAAEALVGPSALEALEVLRDAALLQVPVAGRFALLGSVRAFAREQTPAAQAEALALDHALRCLDAGGSREDLYAAARTFVVRADPRAADLLEALGAAAPGRHLLLLNDAVAGVGGAAILRARGRALRLRGRPQEAQRDFEAALTATDDVRVRGHLLREIAVLHHAARRNVEAREGYERALVCHREAGDIHGEAITIGNLGALDHDACHYEDAELHYEAALAGLRAVGDRRTEATFLANQAVLRQEQGALAAAEVAYRRALALQRQAGDPRMEAITVGNLGLLLHELGRLDEARTSHEEAARLFGDVDDPASLALCLARLGAALAALGEMDRAEQALARAEHVAAPLRDPNLDSVVSLFRAFLDQARGDRSGVEARIERSAAAREHSGDARVAVRLLRGPETLVVLPEGFVAPGGSTSDLSRYASCRRMFQRLVDARVEHPGEALSLEALFAAGWPGETIAPDSIRNRVHVNLARLRTLGLKAVLLRTEAGYHLDPAVALQRPDA